MEQEFREGCAWVDGEYLPIAQARIPITDVGFSKSDATYDVVAVWKGRFFRLEDHLDRFERSWKGLWLEPPVRRTEMREILFECVRRSELREAYVDMIVTRGISRHGSRDPREFDNRFYAYAIPYVWVMQLEKQEKGGHLVIPERTVRIPPEAVDPTIKNFHWGDLTRGIFEAYERGGEYAVLLDVDGNVTEGPGFNVFVVKDAVLFTPPSGALEGITRRTVLELAREAGIEAHAEAIPRDRMAGADEIFATSTAGGVMPMTSLDGRPVGSGVPGAVTLELRRLYWEAHEDPRWTEAVDYDD